MTERSIRTSVQPATVSGGGDVAERLQDIVTGWRGAERGQPLIDLHDACKHAAGVGGRHLVPADVVFVQHLDTTTLEAVLRRTVRGVRASEVRFRVSPVGRVDAMLVPVKEVGSGEYRWLLALDDQLPGKDQVALYGHALGHLLFNRDQAQMGQLPPLDPRTGFSHFDTLDNLRRFEQVERPFDRRVLQAYPQLAQLLAERDTPLGAEDSSTTNLRQRLAHLGWRGPLVTTPYVFTDGRIFVSGTAIRRGTKLRADALLRAEASMPIALVHVARPHEARDVAEQRLVQYARQRLALPFAYLLADDGTVHEWDWSTSEEAVRTTRNDLPIRDELLARWTQALGLNDDVARNALLHPYQPSGPKLRYYQEAAVNRAIAAALQARRGRRQPRILLTMATGTGKTKVAFQIAWKLKRARAIRKLLFITDRDYLLTQAMDNEFSPFGDARHRIQGELSSSRDIIFATYQAIAGDSYRQAIYRHYPPNFFDVVIIDECHRGSAQDEGNWRNILQYFDSAVQIGMTATPLRTDNVQTYTYFGEPLYSYSLRAGINDGFLAPYRVRRILLGHAAEKQGDKTDTAPPAVAATDATTNAQNTQAGMHVGAATAATPVETPASLREHTPTIAHHLADYLRRTDPLAKTIVFCVDQAHADQMRNELEAACANLVARYPGYVERIVADEGTDGRRALGRFSDANERTPVIVTTSKLLSTGVDVPTCKNIVLVKPVSTMVEFKQIIGRGTRLHEPDKTWFTILDYAGVTRLFFDPEFDGDPEVVEVEALVPQPPAAESSEAQNSVPAQAPPADPIPAPGSAGNAAANTAPTPVPDPALPERDEGEPTTQQEAETSPSPSYEPAVHAAPAEATQAQAAAPEQPSEVRGDTTLPPDATLVPNPDNKAPMTDPGTSYNPSAEPKPAAQTQTPDGRQVRVVGEVVYELAPDGVTLRTLSYKNYTVKALEGVVASAADLRARWLHPEQREEIRSHLTDEGIDLPALAASINARDVDVFDLLLYVAFGQPALTRRERADRVRREQAAFFEQHQPAARAILDAVLQKYIAGEAEDVSDTEVLKVPPLREQGTFVELARPFGGGTQLRTSLTELHTLLYSA